VSSLIFNIIDRTSSFDALATVARATCQTAAMLYGKAAAMACEEAAMVVGNMVAVVRKKGIAR